MVLGEPGIGKSTLVNGLIGDEIAETSAEGFLATQGITTEVKIYPHRKNNAVINICDRTWEKGPLRALLQNRVIGIQG